MSVKSILYHHPAWQKFLKLPRAFSSPPLVSALVLSLVFALSPVNPFAPSSLLAKTSANGKDLSFHSQSSKWAIGVEGGFGFGNVAPGALWFKGFPDSVLAISLHIPKTQMLLSAGFFGVGWGGYGVNANADFFLAAKSPINWLELHIFLGFGASLYSYSNGLAISAGLRLPLGASFWLVHWLELYVKLTPILGLGLGIADPFRVWLHVDAPLDIGVRFWF